MLLRLFTHYNKFASWQAYRYFRLLFSSRQRAAIPVALTFQLIAAVMESSFNNINAMVLLHRRSSSQQQIMDFQWKTAMAIVGMFPAESLLQGLKCRCGHVRGCPIRSLTSFQTRMGPSISSQWRTTTCALTLIGAARTIMLWCSCGIAMVPRPNPSNYMQHTLSHP